MDPQQKGELQPNDWTLLRSTEYYCTFLEASPWDWANPLLWNILGVNRRIPRALGSNAFINAHFHPLGTKQFPPVCTSVFTFRIWGLRGGKPVSHTVLKDLLHHSVIATQHSIIANLQQNSFKKPLHYSKSAQHCSADSASSWSSWDILRHRVRCYPAQPSLWTSRSHVVHECWLEMHKPIAISPIPWANIEKPSISYLSKVNQGVTWPKHSLAFGSAFSTACASEVCLGAAWCRNMKINCLEPDFNMGYTS